MSERVWFITGTSSGFGRAIAEKALAEGDRVVATARRPETLADLAERGGDRVLTVALDVLDPGSRERAVAAAVERFGSVGVLVNNAGRTQVGAVEETTEEELRTLFDLHLFAPAALTRLVLPVMRPAGGGTIVQMSSVGGQVTAPGFGAYCATKFALEGLTQSLADEVRGFGIRTIIVEPGAFRTGLFAGAAPVKSAPMEEYAETVGPTRAYVDSGDGTQAGDPAKAAAAIHEAVSSDDPPLRLVLGADAVENIRAELERRGDELSRWEALGRATAFDES